MTNLTLSDFEKAILMAAARMAISLKKWRHFTEEEAFEYLMVHFNILRDRSGNIAGFTRPGMDYLSFDITSQGIYQFGCREQLARFDRIDEAQNLTDHRYVNNVYCCSCGRGGNEWLETRKLYASFYSK